MWVVSDFSLCQHNAPDNRVCSLCALLISLIDQPLSSVSHIISVQIESFPALIDRKVSAEGFVQLLHQFGVMLLFSLVTNRTVCDIELIKHVFD